MNALILGNVMSQWVRPNWGDSSEIWWSPLSPENEYLLRAFSFRETPRTQHVPFYPFGSYIAITKISLFTGEVLNQESYGRVETYPDIRNLWQESLTRTRTHSTSDQESGWPSQIIKVFYNKQALFRIQSRNRVPTYKAPCGLMWWILTNQRGFVF